MDPRGEEKMRMVGRKRLKHRVADASALIVIGVVLTPVIVVGVGMGWTGIYSYLAARELAVGR